MISKHPANQGGHSYSHSLGYSGTSKPSRSNHATDHMQSYAANVLRPLPCSRLQSDALTSS